MKLITEIEGERVPLDVRREGARVVAHIGERDYELEARELGAGVYLLLFEGRVYECRVDGTTKGRGALEVHVGGRAHSVTLYDPKRLRGAQSAGGQADGRVEVKAPMPGKVVRVLVERGASVAAGDGLVVVEAMKMQNELKSPKAGTIVELHAETGATVNAGDVLAVIE
ncbi:MAG: biotin/lipoyl-binding protein [Acidobacteria bacterium]|nr:biotin/lipoyl-binding protein [Acidobacteriota bacterium]